MHETLFVTHSYTPGRKASAIHQPPTSPPSLSSTSTIAQSTSAASAQGSAADDYFTLRSRKRSRQDSRAQATSLHTPLSGPGSWTQCASPPSSGVFGPDATKSYVNDRYHLAGGFDTPALAAMTTGMDIDGPEQWHEDGHEGRRRLREEYGDSAPPPPFPPLSRPLAKERNGVPRWSGKSAATDAPSTCWPMRAFNLVGKVFSFGTSVIKGFYAGGGEGYSFGENEHGPQTPAYAWKPPRMSQFEGSCTPVPGSWQDYDEDARDANFHIPPAQRQSPTGHPVKKRRQTAGESWILVSQPSTPNEGAIPRRSSISNIGTPRSRPSASRANSRRSLAPQLRRQSSFYAYSHGRNPGVAQTTYSHSAKTSPIEQQPNPLSRHASFASTRSPTSRPYSPPSTNHQFHNSTSNAQQPLTPDKERPSSKASTRHSRRPSSATAATTPLSPEADRYLRRQARADRAADRAMNSMSRRLEDLIRQGQAALGTKFSVEGHHHGHHSSIGSHLAGEEAYDDDDEGFVDDDDDGGVNVIGAW